MTNKLMSLSFGALLLAGVAVAQDKKDPVVAGKEVFDQCRVCHNADSDEKKMGPGLKDLMKKAKMKNGKAPTDENVRAIVKAGGNGMPAYEDMLSKDELTQLMAYLKTI